MNNSLKKITAKELFEVVEEMAKRMTAHEIKKLIQYPKLWDPMISVMKEQPELFLAHGIWVSAEDVIERENYRLKKLELEPNTFCWEGEKTPPSRTEDMEHDEVWVIETHLGNPIQSIRFYIQWILDNHHGSISAWPSIKNDIENMSLIEEIAFKPFTRRWRKVAMSTNIIERKFRNSVFKESKISAIDALAGLAQNPERILKMDGKRWPYVTIGGIIIVPDQEQQQMPSDLFLSITSTENRAQLLLKPKPMRCECPWAVPQPTY